MNQKLIKQLTHVAVLTIGLLCGFAHAVTPDWIVQVSGGKTNEQDARKIISSVRYWSREYAVPEDLVFRMMYVESRYVKNRHSKADARGLLQVVPKWHKEKIADLPDQSLWPINANVKTGVRIVREYLDVCRGDLRCAMHRYNGLYGHPTEYYNLVRKAPVPKRQEVTALDFSNKPDKSVTPPPKTKPYNRPPTNRGEVWTKAPEMETPRVAQTTLQRLTVAQNQRNTEIANSAAIIQTRLENFAALIKSKREQPHLN